MVPALINDHYVIRFAICAQNAADEDIDFAWDVITTCAAGVLLSRNDSNRESLKLDSENTSEEEDEVFSDFENDIIFDNQRSNLSRSKLRRSLFLKMVSDPKCYNPKVQKSLSMDSKRRCSDSSKYVSTPDYYFGSPI